MRPINADGLKVFFSDWYDSDKFTVGDIMKVIENQPTVDAEPVRHGHWIITGGTNVFGGTEIVCSECHDRVMVQRVEDELYCRHCGAKMDEEKEE